MRTRMDRTSGGGVGRLSGLAVEALGVFPLGRPATVGRAGLGQPQGEGGALALGAPHRDLPAVRGGHVFHDREAQPRAAGGTGAGGVDAVEALEDALLVLVGDADALVGHGDLDQVPAGLRDRTDRDAHAGAGGRVVDRVLDQVAECGGELSTVAPDPQALGARGGHGDLLGARLVPAPVDGLGDQFPDRDRLGVLQRVVVLHAGEVDQLLHQVGQPGRLDLHAPREPLHGLGVVGGVHHGLGQQGQRPDGGLELMADVGDEVAPHGLDAAGLGEVLHQQQHQPGAERRHPRGHREGLAASGPPGGGGPAPPAVSRRPAGCPGPSSASAPRRACRRGPVRGRTRPSWPSPRRRSRRGPRRTSAVRRARCRHRAGARRRCAARCVWGAAARVH